MISEKGGGDRRKEKRRKWIQAENIKREKMGRKKGRKVNRFLVFTTHSRRLSIVFQAGHNLAGPNGMAGSPNTVKY